MEHTAAKSLDGTDLGKHVTFGGGNQAIRGRIVQIEHALSHGELEIRVTVESLENEIEFQLTPDANLELDA